MLEIPPSDISAIDISLGKDANNHNINKIISYRLLSDTRPKTYNLQLRTGESYNDFSKDGIIRNKILVVKASRCESSELNIKSIWLINGSGTITASFERNVHDY